MAQEYWSLHAHLAAAAPPEFVATLREKDGDEARARQRGRDAGHRRRGRAARPSWSRRSTGASAARTRRRRSSRRRSSRTRARKLRFSASKTMMVAQQLYEGVDIGDGGPVGLITYMRTDSPRVAAEAQSLARDVIAGPVRRRYPARPPALLPGRGRSAQEAHEAIRPTLLDHPPERLARTSSRDQLALYRLIWERFLASQMRAGALRHPDGGRDGRAVPLPGAGLPAPRARVHGRLHRGARRVGRAHGPGGRRVRGLGDAAARGRPAPRPASGSSRSSTSPSRRPATPRPRW